MPASFPDIACSLAAGGLASHIRSGRAMTEHLSSSRQRRKGSKASKPKKADNYPPPLPLARCCLRFLPMSSAAPLCSSRSEALGGPSDGLPLAILRVSRGRTPADCGFSAYATSVGREHCPCLCAQEPARGASSLTTASPPTRGRTIIISRCSLRQGALDGPAWRAPERPASTAVFAPAARRSADFGLPSL